MGITAKLSISNNSKEIVELLETHSTPLENLESLDPLMEYIGNAKYVLLGEASHGTHEYYTWRAKITQRLIEEKGFTFVGVEGDWPDCYQLNRYAKESLDVKKDLFSIMTEFKRWPTWIWANWETVAFIEWLKDYNKNFQTDKKIGFYGLDIYSFSESMNSIITFLEKNDTDTLKIAKEVIKYFEPYSKDEGQTYAKASAFTTELCEKKIHTLLTEIQKNTANYNSDAENIMSTEQNAFVVKNIEKYYRAMAIRKSTAWNIRDEHMASTIERISKFHGNNTKVIIWEHNTHIGDARATDMNSEGMLNVGQLLKEQYTDQGVIAIGFGSYKGSVVAGKSWGDTALKINMPEAKEESWEHLFHLASNGQHKLLLMNPVRKEKCLSNHIAHRAIGVVYNPEHEKLANYVPTVFPKKYDAFVYLDKTTALHPINIQDNPNLAPETYPFGM